MSIETDEDGTVIYVKEKSSNETSNVDEKDKPSEKRKNFIIFIIYIMLTFCVKKI